MLVYYTQIISGKKEKKTLATNLQLALKPGIPCYFSNAKA
jgi:hypothetical protein